MTRVPDDAARSHERRQDCTSTRYNRRMGKFIALLVLLAAAAGAAWYFAGEADPPVIEIAQPARLVGQTGELDVTVAAPRGELTRLEVTLQQGTTRLPVFALP